MKYIRLYEDLNNEPQSGDYAICTDYYAHKGIYRVEHEKYMNFLFNNIGIIKVKIDDPDNGFYNNKYYIKYEDIPNDIQMFFDWKGDEGSSRVFRICDINEILFHSGNRKECEDMLSILKTTQKYNL